MNFQFQTRCKISAKNPNNLNETQTISIQVTDLEPKDLTIPNLILHPQSRPM